MVTGTPMRRRTGRPRNRLAADARREIKATFSRFLSILVLSALAVAFLAGLRTAAPDMEYTADNYYDRAGFMDGYVLSTLGLTEEDLEALSAAPGVSCAEGDRTADAVARDKVVVVRSLPERINLPELVRGRMPQSPDECITEPLMLVKLGVDLGGTVELTLDEDHADDLSCTTLTVVGVANSPLYVGTDRGSSSLGTGSADGFLYVLPECFTMDYYTAAYLNFEGLAALDSYSDEYKDRLEEYLDGLDELKEERARARYDSLIGDAQKELDDARAELEDKKAEADRELSDAWKELTDARKELDDGWAEYRDGQADYDRETGDAADELEDARKKLNRAQKDVNKAKAKYDDGLAEYQDGLAELEENRQKLTDAQAGLEDARKELLDGEAEVQRNRKQLDDAQAQLDAQKEQLDAQQAQVDAGYAAYEQALKPYEGTPYYAQAAAGAAAQKAELDAAQAQLDAGMAQLEDAQRELDGGRAELTAAEKALAEGRTELEDGQKEIDDGLAQLTAAQAELDDARVQLEDAAAQIAGAEKEIADGWVKYWKGRRELEKAVEDGRVELEDALRKLEDGEKEYADGLAEYEDGKKEADEKIAEAEEKLADAQRELDEVEECKWYVLGRSTNSGFEGYAQDAERVGNLADIFPLIFFLVAGLACLTTMTRMVEDQRTQIGALKAMGFSRYAISKKYIGYALRASLSGGILGLAIGCTLFPLVIANAFNIMYNIPPLQFKPQPVICIAAVLAAIAVTTGAALWACLSTLMDTPANLMRPRSPKAGKRVFLEHVGFIWKRLSFTWKVTVRNLFRYQKRFWMTVIGIGGCTALIVTGFGLHDSIFAILDKQFDEISLYDATVGLDDKASEARRQRVFDFLDGSPSVERWLDVFLTHGEASTTGSARSVNIYAVSDAGDFRRFIDLRHRLDDSEVAFPEDGVLITEKLSELLQVKPGDVITLDKDGRRQVTVADVVENYVFHNVYMTDELYSSLFREEPEPNTVLLAYSGSVGAAESDELSTTLMGMEAVASYSYIATLRDTFTNSMHAINYAVIIIIASAAALAFVVLYNLTNINITERIRELATLKVLGFYDMETTAYVYRENIFLTLFGIALGLLLGRYMHAWMVTTVEVDIVMFGRTAPPYAYTLAAALTAVFSVMVNIAAHFKLKKVDMVESLKTVE